MGHLPEWLGSSFQTVMSLPLAIPSAWATHLPLSELPDNVVDGFSVCAGLGVGVVQPEPGLSYDDDDLFASNPVDMIC